MTPRTGQPDLVIFDATAHANIKRLVRGAGVAILELPWAASLEDAEALISRMATALGREAVGQAIVSDMRDQRRRLAWRPEEEAHALAAPPGGRHPLEGDAAERQVLDPHQVPLAVRQLDLGEQLLRAPPGGPQATEGGAVFQSGGRQRAGAAGNRDAEP